MPTYNYKCESCEHETEKILSIKDMDIPLEEPCEQCGMFGTIRRKIYANEGFRADVPPPHAGGFRDVMRKIKKTHPLAKIPNY